MDSILEIKKLSKIIKNKKILDDVTLNFFPGEIVGLVGPNGAGKTTLIRCCCGLNSISSGSISIDGFSLKTEFEKATGCISMTMDGDSFYKDLTAVENINCFFPYQRIDKKRIDDILEIVGLSARKNTLVKTYSLGMKQRLNLALALVNQPKLVFLDEPFNGVDPSGVNEFRKIIDSMAKAHKITFVIATHNLAELQKFADRVVFIDKGKIKGNEDICQEKIYVSFEFEEEQYAERILEARYSFIKKDRRINVCIEKQKMNELLTELAMNNVIIRDMSIESFIEAEYLQIIGESNID